MTCKIIMIIRSTGGGRRQTQDGILLTTSRLLLTDNTGDNNKQCSVYFYLSCGIFRSARFPSECFSRLLLESADPEKGGKKLFLRTPLGVLFISFVFPLPLLFFAALLSELRI